RDHGARGVLLLGVMEEDGGAVLGALIGALPVEGGGVVNGEEHGEQVPVADHRRVKGDLYHLRVAGVPLADGTVGRIGALAPGVAGLHRLHAPELLEGRFEAPEAAARQGGELGTVRSHVLRYRTCRKVMPRTARDMVEAFTR